MPPLKKIHEEDVPEKEILGLKDGGHTYFRCSNCQAYLLDYWCTQPAEELVWQVKAGNCPFCDEAGMGELGGSFIQEVRGHFTVGGFGLTKPDDPEDSIMSTIDDGFDLVDKVVVHKIAKAHQHAKPIRSLAN